MDRDSNSRLGVETGRGENLDEFRSARLFDISNAPLLISYASTNINLSFQAENQPDPVLSLSLSFSSLPSMAEETRRNSVDILHGIIRTRGPLRPIHTIHYTRQGYLLRDAVQLCIRCAHPSSVPLVSLFTDTCSFHWHDARITEERISLEPYKARIAGKFNVLRAL